MLSLSAATPNLVAVPCQQLNCECILALKITGPANSRAKRPSLASGGTLDILTEMAVKLSYMHTIYINNVRSAPNSDIITSRSGGHAP